MIAMALPLERRRRRTRGGPRAYCARAAGRRGLSEPRWPSPNSKRPNPARTRGGVFV